MVSLFLECDGMRREPWDSVTCYQVQACSARLTTPVSSTDDVLKQEIATLFGNFAD